MAINDVKQFGIRFDHIGIHVASIERSFEWYHTMFGLCLLKSNQGYKQGPFPRMKKVGQSDFLLEVYEVQNALPGTFRDYEMTEGVKHLGLKIKHFKPWLTYAKQNGANILMEDFRGGNDLHVFVADPDGILIECVQDRSITESEEDSALPFELNSVTDASVFGISLDHVALHVHDAEATSRWYAEMYGFEKDGEAYEPHPCMAPRVQCIKLDEFKLELYEVQDAKPFNFVDMEFTTGAKHIDFGIKDRVGWLNYIKANTNADIVVEIHSNGSGAIYLNDNSGMLVETNRWFD